jgi:hypothetical protein
MDPDVVVILASLNQQDPLIRILSQALSQHAAGTTRPDDDVIVEIISIGFSHSRFSKQIFY